MKESRTRGPARLVAELKLMYHAVRISPNLGVLLSAGIVSWLAAGILSPVLPLFLRSKGISFQGLGYIFSAAAVMPVLLQPLMGWLADRVGRRIMIVSTSFFISLVLPVYAFLSSVKGFAVVHAARVAVATSSMPAINAMMGDVTPAASRATVFGVYGSFQTLAYVVALFGSGLLLKAGLGYSVAFYVSSGLFLVSSLVLLVWLRETVGLSAPAGAADGGAGLRVEAARPRPRLPLVESLRLVLGSRSLTGLMLLQFCFGFSLAAFPAYIPLHAERLGAEREWIGGIVATAWLTYALMQPLGGRTSDRLRRRKGLLLLGLGLIFLSVLLLGLARSLWPMIVFWAATGIGDGLYRPGYSALIVDLVPAQARGRYFGAVGAAMTLAGVLAPLLYGFLADRCGIPSAFLASAAALVVGWCLAWALIAEKPRPRGEGA
ncbi:MAG: MFS transporter [Acetobacteraceae bacterium]|nr:MFS transporter [Acetobacteraceae bacterium]